VPFAYGVRDGTARLRSRPRRLCSSALERPDAFPCGRSGPYLVRHFADTLQLGLKELREPGLLSIDVDWRKGAALTSGIRGGNAYTRSRRLRAEESA